LAGIAKDCHSRHARRNLLEQLQPFPGYAEFPYHETRGVAARPRQAVDDAGADRIDAEREHDRHGAGRLQQRPHARTGSEDDVGRECGQFRRLPANFGGTGRAPAGVDAHVTANGPTQHRQRLLERPDAGLPLRIVRGGGQEQANAPHPIGLLRARRKWPRRCRAAEQRDELAPFQLIELHPLPLVRVTA
jgi:hypothetical protein